MKKIFSILILIVLVFSLVGCETETSNEIEKLALPNESDENISIWTDKETGVQYIIYDNKVGYGGMGGITPRFNADGTLYISTEKGGE
jgi:uncharacterized lipoprotein YehR (DUF1307 family)